MILNTGIMGHEDEFTKELEAEMESFEAQYPLDMGGIEMIIEESYEARLDLMTTMYECDMAEINHRHAVTESANVEETEAVFEAENAGRLKKIMTSIADAFRAMGQMIMKVLEAAKRKFMQYKMDGKTFAKTYKGQVKVQSVKIKGYNFPTGNTIPSIDEIFSAFNQEAMSTGGPIEYLNSKENAVADFAESKKKGIQSAAAKLAGASGSMDLGEYQAAVKKLAFGGEAAEITVNVADAIKVLEGGIDAKITELKNAQKSVKTNFDKIVKIVLTSDSKVDKEKEGQATAMLSAYKNAISEVKSLYLRRVNAELTATKANLSQCKSVVAKGCKAEKAKKEEKADKTEKTEKEDK